MSNYFYCPECEEVFPEEHAKTLINEWGGSVYACPDCRNTHIHDAEKCKICGEPIDPWHEICGDCKWKLRKIWEKAVESVMDLCEDGADYCEAEQRFKEFLDDNGVI